MNMSPLKLYFKYVQDVLGIKQIFSSNSNSAVGNGLLVTVVISIEGLRSYTPEENDLLQKMISALKLGGSQVLSIDDSSDLPPSRFRLHLTDQSQSFNEQPEGVFNTWSPRHLLKNPGHKKEAWTVMQTLLQHINP